MYLALQHHALRRIRFGLRQSLPGIPSSHLAEALAAAMGFRTAIALKAAEREAAGGTRIQVDLSRFASRLDDLGHRVPRGQSVEALISATESDDTVEGVPRDLAGHGFTRAQIRHLSEAARFSYGILAVGGSMRHGKTTLLNRLLRDVMAGLHPKAQALLLREDAGPKPRRWEPLPPGVTVLNAVRGGDTPDEAKIKQNAITARLKSDPDVIVISEIAGPEETKLAFMASMTGHIAVVCLPAISRAGDMMRRFLDLGTADYVAFDHTLTRCLVAQRLVRPLCTECSIPWHEARQAGLLQDTTDLERRFRADDLSSIRVAAPGGCSHCHGRGRRGREAIAEVVLTDAAFMAMIRSGETLEARSRWLTEHGGLSINEHAAAKVLAGRLDPRDCEDLGARFWELDADRVAAILAVRDEEREATRPSARGPNVRCLS